MAEETDEPRHREDHDHKADSGRDHDHDHGSDFEHDHDHEADSGHDHHHHDIDQLGFAVVTVSSSRRIDDDDTSGDAIIELLEDAGHTVAVRELVNDDYDGLQDTIDRLANRKDTDCIVTTGGTGVTPDDVTIEAIQPLFEKRLPGFGELFRSLSVDEIGTRVVGTRATAGIADGVPAFCLPGSENAVRLGTREIIVEEAPHLAGLAKRDETDTEGADDANGNGN